MRYIIFLLLCATLNCLSAKNNYSVNDSFPCDCYCYFDTIYNRIIYSDYDIPPKPLCSRSVYDIAKKVKIPKSLLDQNGEYIYVRRITLNVIVDEDGKVLSYKIRENKNDSEYRRAILKNKDIFAELILDVFEKEKYWIPAICKNEKVASSYNIVLDINNVR